MPVLSGFSYDAVIVGAGPNGLAAAIRLAEKGKSVLVIEAESQIGGAARSGELTLPGFIHDLGSAVHPLAIASPYLAKMPLAQHGLEWIHPQLELAHPLDDGTAVVLARSVEKTAEGLGPDERRYREIFRYLSEHSEALFSDILAPLKIPKHPMLMARFGLGALLSARTYADREFHGIRARALFAGIAAHSFLKFSTPTSAAIALVLGTAGHGKGWPIPRGGAGKITEAMASYFRSLGGTIETGRVIRSAVDIPSSRAVLFDLIPRHVVKVGGEKIPESYRKSIEGFQPGPGVFKLDYALSAPIPWTAKECLQAGTIHLGGTFEEIEASEESHWKNEVCAKPFVLLSQPSLFDSSRAPAGKQVAWAYCHVPWGSTVDMTDAIEAQIERFAPGFKATILKRTKSFPADLEKQNRNLVGGDISGGAPTPMQLFFRPALKMDPYRIPGELPWWICSSSAPPGAGVHGMCGFHAAESALKKGI